MNFDSSNTVRQNSNRVVRAIGPTPSREQPFNHREQEASLTKGGLQKSHLMQWLICRVSRQIKNKLHDFTPGKDGTACFAHSVGETVDGLRHLTKAI